MFLPFQPADIYPLLCPVREYDWIPDWHCEVIRAESGVNEKGCIFRTNFDGFGGPEIWVTSVYEPNERLEFVRTSPSLVTIFQITLTRENSGTELTWAQTVTSLNPEGNLLLEKGNPDDYTQMVKKLETLLNDHLGKQKPRQPKTAQECAPSAN